MTRIHAAAVVAVATSVLVAQPRAGAEAQAPRGLMATSEKGCTVETRPVSFGIYDTTSNQSRSGQGQVIYTCGEKTASGVEATGVKNIRIEISTGGAGSYDRRMSAGGSDRLFYNIYLDASYRTVWGNGSGGTDYYFDPHPPNKKPVTVTAYGLISGMQDVSIGQYSDVLQVKILF